MSVYQLNCLNMDWSTDWTKLFGAERPLIVEIGFGNGDYLLALAKKYPDCNIIGFEISNTSIEKAQMKITKHGLEHVKVIYSFAESALNHLFQPASVREFHINYPDPWFKSRHSKRRLMQRDTLDALASRLEVGGLLYLATDILEYAEMSHELLAATPSLTNLLDSAWVNDFPERLIRTKYEEKGYAEGRQGHFFKYRRNEQAVPFIPVKEELPVPHVVLSSPLSALEVAKAFQKMTFHPRPDIHIAALNAFHNPRFDSGLFELVIEEGTIEQHIALQLTPKGDDLPNVYTLRYAPFGQPRATDGMHQAVRCLGEWIVSLHPEARITAKSLRE